MNEYSVYYISNTYKVIIQMRFWKDYGKGLQLKSAFPKIRKLQDEITKGRH